MNLNLVSKTIRFIFLIAIVVIIASCSRGSAPICVYGDDFGDLTKKSLVVPAYSSTSDTTTSSTVPDYKWIDTGVDVNIGTALQVVTTGNMELCPSEITTAIINIPTTPSSNGWVQALDSTTNKPIYISMGTSWSIQSISGGFYTDSRTVRTDTDSGSYIEPIGSPITAGKNLYVFVGDINNINNYPHPNMSQVLGSGLTSNWFGNFSSGAATMNSYIFSELYDSNTGNTNYIKQIGTAYSGYLYFRVRGYRGAVDFSANQPWGVDTDYSRIVGNNVANITGGTNPFSRGYQVVIKYTKTCKGVSGQFMQAAIGSSPTSVGAVYEMWNAPSTTGLSVFPNSDFPERGSFNGYAWDTGRLYLRIHEDGNVLDGITRGESSPNYARQSYVFKDPDGNNVPIPPGDQCMDVGTLYQAQGSTANSSVTVTGSNCGFYKVNITTISQPNPLISNIITDVITPVKTLMNGDPSNNRVGLTETMYKALTKDFDYISSVRAVLALSIVLYGLMYMMGMKETDRTAFTNYIIKISLIFVLIGPNSWNFFYKYLFTVFINGTDEVVYYTSGQFADLISNQNSFNNINQMFIPKNISTCNGVVVPNNSACSTPLVTTENQNYKNLVNSPYSVKTTIVNPDGSANDGIYNGSLVPKIIQSFIKETDPQYANTVGGYSVVLNGVQGKLVDKSALQVTPGQNTGRDAFVFLDQTILKFFSTQTNIKLAGLLWHFPLGPIYTIGIYVGMFFFLVGVFRAVFMYMISIIMVSFMLFLAPLFIIFTLFEKLKSFFDSYIKYLISYMLQPMFMFMVLSIFNVFVYSVFYQLLSFTVCWSCVVWIDFPFNDWFSVAQNFDKFCFVFGYKVWGTAQSQDLSTSMAKMPITFTTLLIFLIFTNALNKFLGWIVEMSQTISTGLASMSLDRGQQVAMNGIKAVAGTTAGAISAASPLVTPLLKGAKNGAARAARSFRDNVVYRNTPENKAYRQYKSEQRSNTKMQDKLDKKQISSLKKELKDVNNMGKAERKQSLQDKQKLRNISKKMDSWFAQQGKVHNQGQQKSKKVEGNKSGETDV